MTDNFESWKQDATAHFATAEVCFDRALVARFEQAVRELELATRGTTSMLEGPAKEIEDRVSQLEEEIKEKTRELKFESIGSRAWQELQADHPPTENELDQRARYNVETFVPAALARTCTSPGLTVEQAKWIIETMPEGVVGDVVKACFDANLEGGDVKKAAATAAVVRSRSKLTQR